MRTTLWLGLLLCQLVVTARAQGVAVEAGQEERRAKPIGQRDPLPRRTLAVTPAYPPEAAAVDATGVVRLRVTVNELGRVSEVRRFVALPLIFPGVATSSDRLRDASEALQRSAADAVAQWQYEPPADAPVTFTVAIAFKPGAEPAVSHELAPVPRTWEKADFGTPSSSPAPDDAWAPGVLRADRDVASPRRVKHAVPVFPASARDGRISGVVVMEALVGPDGRVADVRVLAPLPPLDSAAVDAVKQWEYEPVLMNGVPVPVVITVVVRFDS